MIRLTYEQKQKNSELRHQIIDEIMEIQDTGSLNAVRTMSKTMLRQEYCDHMLSLEDAIAMTDMDLIGKLYRLFSEGEDCVVKEQTLELCEEAIQYYVDHGGSRSELVGPCGALEG